MYLYFGSLNLYACIKNTVLNTYKRYFKVWKKNYNKSTEH